MTPDVHRLIGQNEEAAEAMGTSEHSSQTVTLQNRVLPLPNTGQTTTLLHSQGQGIR